mmetsp:Transcript_654/g.1182  ORF Transcript_654/g.1182 Transcript_654/m.1182 type:complete len:162 (+) Transcript_654:132-617(+)
MPVSYMFPLIRKVLRHREPFLFIDRIVYNDIGTSVAAQSILCENGKLTRLELLEAVGQACSLVLAQMELYKSRGTPVFAGMQSVEWYKHRAASDLYQYRVVLYGRLGKRHRQNTGFMSGDAYLINEELPESLDKAKLEHILTQTEKLCSSQLIFSFMQPDS